jgi:class 3 adenylate cyclase
MDIIAVVAQVRKLLQQQGRLSYRIVQRQFALDDAALEDLKFELIDIQEVAVDKDGKMLVWKGTVGEQEANSDEPPTAAAPEPRLALRPPPYASRPDAERRQLTVMFCDLVGSTALSEQLDPEEWRGIVQEYHRVCAEVICRFEGHIAQYLGDGLLVYFGYPTAHEDDTQRAVRTGLGIVEALQKLNTRLPHPLQVRIGIHTGLVVVGEIGGGGKHEHLAVGETPNLAARLQGITEPDTVVISATTQRLIRGYFECHDLGPHSFKGISTPVLVYQVLGESGARSRFEVAVSRGLTPLVGREEEVGLLLKRWERAKAGEGQVVLLSGEAGIGKSRLVQILKEHIAEERSARVECRCSPYSQNSAFYPVIEHLQRLLHFNREDAPEEKLRKLERGVPPSLPPESIALLVALLSLPLPAHSPAFSLTPQRQKQKTLGALLAWLLQGSRRTASACCHGRLTLGGSFHAGISQSPDRPSPHNALSASTDLSAGLQPTVGDALPYNPAHAESLKAQAGGGDGRKGDGRQNATSSSGPAIGHED